jgi:hypothetical protein
LFGACILVLGISSGACFLYLALKGVTEHRFRLLVLFQLDRHFGRSAIIHRDLDILYLIIKSVDLNLVFARFHTDKEHMATVRTGYSSELELAGRLFFGNYLGPGERISGVISDSDGDIAGAASTTWQHRD